MGGGFGEVTAEDVACYDRMLESEWKGDHVAYDHTDVKDRYSGTIVLNQPFAPFMSATLASGTGIINCKKALEGAGGDTLLKRQPPAVLMSFRSISRVQHLDCDPIPTGMAQSQLLRTLTAFS